jgi:hypothetical protein
MPKLVTYRQDVMTKYNVVKTEYTHAIITDLPHFMLRKRSDKVNFAILNIVEVTQEEANAIAEIYKV